MKLLIYFFTYRFNSFNLLSSSSYNYTLFLNKSRLLLSNDNVSSFLPTIKREQFSDTFKNFTFVENKNNNQIENIFLFDEGNKLKSLSSNDKNKSSTVIVVKKGLVNEKNFYYSMVKLLLQKIILKMKLLNLNKLI